MAILSAAQKKAIEKEKEDARQEGIGFAREAGTRSDVAASKLALLRKEADEQQRTGGLAIDKATKSAQGRARKRVGKALAAGQGGGGFGGGGKTAQLLDVTKTLGDEETEIGVGGALSKEQFLQQSQQRRFGQEKEVGQSEVEASVQKLEGAKFAKEAGTKLQDKQAKGAAYLTQMEEIKAAHKGEGFFEPDDEEGALKAIKNLWELEEDEDLKKILKKEIDRIESFTFIDMAF
jgi:hypothetical protein